MKIQKNALPKPPHPTNTQGFIVYMSMAFTKLVECKRSVKNVCSRILLVLSTKNPQKPSPHRVKLTDTHTHLSHTKSGGQGCRINFAARYRDWALPSENI